jgi:hypothetical protein
VTGSSPCNSLNTFATFLLRLFPTRDKTDLALDFLSKQQFAELFINPSSRPCLSKTKMIKIVRRLGKC